MLFKTIANRWELVSPKDQRAALRQIAGELKEAGIDLPQRLLKDLTINHNAEHWYGMNPVEFLRKDFNGLPTLLDVHNYRLKSFAWLKRASREYALSVPIRCLPKEVKRFLGTIKFSGIGEYGTCWSFVDRYVDRVICSSSLWRINLKKEDTEKQPDENDTREIIPLRGRSVDENIGLYADNSQVVLLKTERSLTCLHSFVAREKNLDETTLAAEMGRYSLIHFAATLFHEAAHKQVNMLRAKGYDIEYPEDERYAQLMSLYVFFRVYTRPGTSDFLKKGLKEHIVIKLKNIYAWNICLNAYEIPGKILLPENNFNQVVFSRQDEIYFHDFRFDFNQDFLEKYVFGDE